MTEQAKVPAIRFAGFTDPWEQRKFSDMYEVNNERNTDCKLGYDRTLSIATMTFNGGNGAADDSLNSYKVIRVGDIAFEGHANKVHAYGRFVLNDAGDGLMSPRFSCLRPIVEQRYSFWKYYIPYEETMRPILVKATKSGTMMNELVPDDLMRESILVPCLAEQEAIGDCLSQLDSLITLHQRKYDKLVVFKKSMLEKMFPKDGESVPEIRFAGFTDPWEQRKLGELALTYSGGTPSAGNSAYYGGEIPFIRSAEIDCDSTELSLTVAGLNNSSAKLVDKGMVLYAMYGATSGEVAISKIKGAINQAILAMDASDMAANRFIAYWLRRQKKSITETFLQGGQGNLSGAIIKELGIPQPSLDEQRQIGSFFSNLDDLITLHQRKLELLQNIKKSLLDKMFV
ncbi:restriction endonuclease subunit S [Bifidobacterium breve]|uniref:restriction endonuclease subunit S n=1 Tax=Bifidobacterium breve TaxID=1685 RepID=UPI00116BB898|nr:Type I restriction modification DNA specificity domain protein [Bifidobacterium breve]